MISGSIGLGLEIEKLDKRLAELDIQYYTSIRKLEIDYGYFVSGHEFTPKIESILSYLPDLTVNDFSKKYFWDSVESQMVLSPFLEALYEEHVTKRDINELLRIRNSIGDTCKLIYDIYGTISGRILITRPCVQYIKRSSRGIFSPRDGYKFIYADYAQFEPGILAYLSSDKVLVDIYNKGDVYSGLACIIGSGCERSVAKEIFLSFVYGMKRENIKRKIKLLYGELSSNNVDEFFNRFQGVDRWKRELIKSCRKSLKCQGVTGYMRKFDSDDTASELERWAPNHMIQSTASGIFKNALMAIAYRLDHGRMIIPMHDAILIEILHDDEEKARNMIEFEMKYSFEKICPNIKCKVCFGDFA